MARPRRSDETRERLLQEGVESFLTHGYHGSGLQQMLDRVSVPKGSFYNYFASKEDFAVEAIRRYAQCFGDKQSAALAAAPDPVTGLRRFFKQLMREFEQAGFVGGCLITNLGAELEGNDTCRKVLQESLEGWRHAVRDALREGQDLNLVRDDIPARDLANLLVDAWEGAVVRMKIERSLKPLRDCVKRLLDGLFKP